MDPWFSRGSLSPKRSGPTGLGGPHRAIPEMNGLLLLGEESPCGPSPNPRPLSPSSEGPRAKGRLGACSSSPGAEAHLDLLLRLRHSGQRDCGNAFCPRARPQGFLSSRSGVGAQESRFETNSPRDADTSDLEATLWTPLTSGNQLSVLLALTIFDQVLKLLTLWGRGDTTRLLCGHVLCEREREGERERGGGPFISHSATGLFPT